MAITNQIIHRFIQPRSEYEENGSLYSQIIPYNVQAYSYELKPNGDPNVPEDYIVRYVLGTGRSTYLEIAEGQGRDEDGNLLPELSKEFVINSSSQLVSLISAVIKQQVLDASYITADANSNPFASYSDLVNATAWYKDGQSVIPAVNDYVVVLSDETHPTGSGENQTTRYVCTNIVNNQPVWAYQFPINTGSLGPAQEAAINSGITTEKVLIYDSYADQIAQALDHLVSTDNPHHVTAAQVGLGNVDNTSDLDKPISTATQTALDTISNNLTTHTNNSDIHVTAAEKTTWNNKQDTLIMGNHININNRIISVEDDLSTYNNSIAQFVNKHVDDLEHYYTKEELEGVYKYCGSVPTYEDLPTGNVYAPDTYYELQYITATQLQYINTLYRPNKNTKIELRFRVNGEGNNYLYGTDLSEPYKVAFGVNYGAHTSVAYFGDKVVNYTSDDQVHDLVQNKSGLYIDNVKVGTYADMDAFTTESEMLLFKTDIADTHPQNISIYEVVIYENDEVVRHYVPVVLNSTHTYGMYEVISEEFCPSESTFSFTGGPRAGYANQNGIVYRVAETGYMYMWYNHDWIVINSSGGGGSVLVDNVTIKEGIDGRISTVGVKTKSDTVMYDWIGTKSDWETGRANHTIPDDWICWITDDSEEQSGVSTLMELPALPIDRTKDYMLQWNHTIQGLKWVEV